MMCFQLWSRNVLLISACSYELGWNHWYKNLHLWSLDTSWTRIVQCSSVSYYIYINNNRCCVIFTTHLWRIRLHPRHRLQRKPLISNPGMPHGTCVTHVPWCMLGSLTHGGGRNVPGIPGECTTRNYTYLQETHGFKYMKNRVLLAINNWVYRDNNDVT